MNTLPDASANPNDPATWSSARQRWVWAAVLVGIWGLGWSFWLSDEMMRWSAESDREPELRQAYLTSLGRAQELPALEARKQALEDKVQRLEQSLPAAAEMEAVLRDITAAGRARGLRFELFRPGPTQIRTGYAELPVSIRVAGAYHDLGGFLGDLARLTRTVTLHNLVLMPQASAPGPSRVAAPDSRVLVMEGTLRAYRALEAAEWAQLRRARDRSPGAGAAPSGAGAGSTPGSGISGPAAGEVSR